MNKTTTRTAPELSLSFPSLPSSRPQRRYIYIDQTIHGVKSAKQLRREAEIKTGLKSYELGELSRSMALLAPTQQSLIPSILHELAWSGSHTQHGRIGYV